MQRQAFLTASLDCLQKKTGINKNRWSEYFTGTSHPSGRTLEKASKTLGIAPHTVQKWIISRREDKKLRSSTCGSLSTEGMIANNDNCLQTKSMKTKKKIGWVRSTEAAYHLEFSTETLRKKRLFEYKEGIHYRIEKSCSQNARRVTYEYNVDAIMEIGNRGDG